MEQSTEAAATEGGRRRIGRLVARGFGAGLGAVVIAGLAASSIVLVERTERLERGLASAAAESVADSRLERLAGIIATSQDVELGTILGTSLVSTRDLPGSGRAVDERRRAALAAATVRLGKRPHGPSDEWPPGWSPACTGTVVEEAGRLYVLSAAHCFDADLLLDDVDYEDDTPDVREVSRKLPFDFAILAGPGDGSVVLAELGELALPVDHSLDWALAVVDDDLPPGITPVPFRLFRDPSMAAIAGEDVGHHTYSSRTLDAAIEAVGTYLGGADDAIGAYDQTVDLVAIEPDSADTDVCFFGASGSSAALASGGFTGPLSFRNTIGYGEARNIESDDIDGKWNLLQMEDATGVVLDETSVVCGYAGYDQPTVDAMFAALR
jgi:hypothetical protein